MNVPVRRRRGHAQQSVPKKSGAHMYAIPPRADCYAWLKNDGSPSVGHAFGEAELVIHMDDVAVIFDECAVEVAENLMLQ